MVRGNPFFLYIPVGREPALKPAGRGAEAALASRVPQRQQPGRGGTPMCWVQQPRLQEASRSVRCTAAAQPSAEEERESSDWDVWNVRELLTRSHSAGKGDGILQVGWQGRDMTGFHFVLISF